MMQKLYTKDKKNFIAYNKQVNAKNKASCVIFLHGFMSNMNGTKALSVEKHCNQKGYNFVRFDNFGCGESSGFFTKQTITSWLEGINLILSMQSETKILLVGSSLGAWLSLLATKLHPKKIIGIITLAAAVDFTENLIWRKLTKADQKIMTKQGVAEVRGTNKNCSSSYPISYELIMDARKHLILDSAIDVNLPVCLIHGMKDYDVPYDISLKIASNLSSECVTLKLIKDADHKLSRPQDLAILNNSIDEIMDLYDF